MAKGAFVPSEEILGRRVMHVDRMFVGEQDLQIPERILGSRRLAHIDRCLVYADIIPVDPVRGDALARRGRDFIAQLVKIGRVVQKLRQHLIDDDRPWHAPIGIVHNGLYPIRALTGVSVQGKIKKVWFDFLPTIARIDSGSLPACM